MKGQRHTKALLGIGLVSACLFGAATPASKALLTGIQPQVLAGLLYLGAAFGVLPVVIQSKSFLPPWQAGRRTLLLLTGAVVMGGILGPLLLLLGLRLASSGSVSLWLNLEFVATVILGHFVFREHLTARGWIAAGGTFVAALLLAGGEGDVGVLSVGLVAAGCLCWGFDNHFTALIDGITPAQTTLWKGLVAGAFNLTLGAVLAGGVGKPELVLVALLVGALAYGLSVTLYIVTAQGFGASRGQMVFSTAPFFGVLLSVSVLGETFTGTQALGAGIIAASLALLFTEKHAHVHRHDSILHQHGHHHMDGHHDHEHSGLPATVSHSHMHEHDPVTHAHKHWPDLHHRHGHTDEEKDRLPNKSDAGDA
ncbi:MAG TPA: DMT family transporter [Desulfobacteraceae bacterium]|nr:DMT family transporter [Desulfobacteraceae bacterium]